MIDLANTKFVKVTGLIIGGIALLLLASTYLFWWFGAVVAGIQHFAVIGKVVAFATVILLLWLLKKLGTAICIFFGLIGAILVFGWPWYFAFLFFLPSVFFGWIGYMVANAMLLVYLVNDIIQHK